MGHPFCHVADVHQWFGIVPGADHRSNDGDQQDRDGDKGNQLQQDILGLRHCHKGNIGVNLKDLPTLLKKGRTAHLGRRSGWR